jgi:hypothetical protein
LVRALVQAVRARQQQRTGQETATQEEQQTRRTA